jgi:DNA-binding response OmpR family regulator
MSEPMDAFACNKILHVEDHTKVVEAFQRWVSCRLPDVTVDVAQTIEEAEAHLLRCSYDAIVLDLGLPRSQGIGTFRRIAAASNGTPILIHTGEDVEEFLRGLLTSVSAGFFAKGGGEMPILLKRLETVLGSPELRLSERQLSELLQTIDEATARLDRALHRLEMGVANGAT